jgi:hypothetical protein
MKKLIAVCTVVLTSAYVRAQTGSSGTKYDYYPEANVYYNDSAKTYWYHDSASGQWKSGAKLPSGYQVTEKAKKNTFYYNGGDVWQRNAEHVKLYGNKINSRTP